MNEWLFYRIAIPLRPAAVALPDGYSSEMWRPRIFRAVPRGLPLFPFGVWWLFHTLHVFANRDYAIFVIRRGGRVVHRSVITPRYFRFPFMAAADIQVGDTWTDPTERGKGLATSALAAVISQVAPAHERTIWYVVEAHNRSSIRVAEKAGFCQVGCGSRTRRWSSEILGAFLLTRLAPRK